MYVLLSKTFFDFFCLAAEAKLLITSSYIKPFEVLVNESQMRTKKYLQFK